MTSTFEEVLLAKNKNQDCYHSGPDFCVETLFIQ